MRRAFLLLALVAGLGMGFPMLHSQAPAPAPAVPAGNALEQLKAIRDLNAKLLDQQAATLQKLEELDKAAQTLKLLGKRT
jgi:hypothetical protein